MIRRALVVAALMGLAAGCVGSEPEKPSPPPSRAAAPQPTVTVEQRPRKRFRVRVRVTVVDGDTNRRVRGAVVRIGRRAARADATGLARLGIGRRGARIRVAADGYLPRAVPATFTKRRFFTVRVYQPELQWPMFGARATRTNAHPHITVRPPFRVAWTRGLGTLIEFPAVVSEGIAYIGNYRGTVRAISMRDGSVAWRRDIPGGKMAASPAVVGRTLVVHGMDGYVRVLDRSGGRVLWEYRVGSPIESSPVVRGGVDYFGTWDGTVYALDLRRRAVRWTYRSGAKMTSSAALAGRSIYIGDYAGRVIALDAVSGRVRWIRSVNGRVYGTPAVADGRVFVPSSTGGSLTAFSTGGRYLWSRSTGSYVYSSPAVWGGRVFFGSYNGVFYCVSARNGATLWTVGTGGPISGAAVVVAGVAYAGSFAHRIIGVDARSGRVLVRFPHGEYVPVSGGGDRLLLHGYSRLYAVESARRRG